MASKWALIFAALFVAGTLASCASTQNYEASLEPWIGKSEKELILGWGIPDKQYQLDANTKLISYIARDTVYYPGTLSTCIETGGRHTAFSNCMGGFPSTIQTLHCETLFTLVNGRITRWGHRGNDCRS